MPSGQNKSGIYNLISKVLSEIPDIDNCWIGETTFEKLGITMQSQNGQAVWFFDEARLFLSQIGLYGKPAAVSRDEAVLLTLYDGGVSIANYIVNILPSTKLHDPCTLVKKYFHLP